MFQDTTSLYYSLNHILPGSQLPSAHSTGSYAQRRKPPVSKHHPTLKDYNGQSALRTFGGGAWKNSLCDVTFVTLREFRLLLPRALLVEVGGERPRGGGVTSLGAREWGWPWGFRMRWSRSKFPQAILCGERLWWHVPPPTCDTWTSAALCMEMPVSAVWRALGREWDV